MSKKKRHLITPTERLPMYHAEEVGGDSEAAVIETPEGGFKIQTRDEEIPFDPTPEVHVHIDLGNVVDDILRIVDRASQQAAMVAMREAAARAEKSYSGLVANPVSADDQGLRILEEPKPRHDSRVRRPKHPPGIPMGGDQQADNPALYILRTGNDPIGKERVYLQPGEEAPSGVEVQEGPRGGRYYEPTGRSRRGLVNHIRNISRQPLEKIPQLVQEVLGDRARGHDLTDVYTQDQPIIAEVLALLPEVPDTPEVIWHTYNGDDMASYLEELASERQMSADDVGKAAAVTVPSMGEYEISLRTLDDQEWGQALRLPGYELFGPFHVMRAIVAHEYAHVLDTELRRFSFSDRWLKAHNVARTAGRLPSLYAQNIPPEQFAEMVALMFLAPRHSQQQYPELYAAIEELLDWHPAEATARKAVGNDRLVLPPRRFITLPNGVHVQVLAESRVEKQGFTHEHDSWPRHPVRVKDHAKYFQEHEGQPSAGREEPEREVGLPTLDAVKSGYDRKMMRLRATMKPPRDQLPGPNPVTAEARHWKRVVARNLASGLETRFNSVQLDKMLETMKRIARIDQVDPFRGAAEDSTRAEMVATGLVGSWAVSSSDNSVMSLCLQRAVTEVFGVEDPDVSYVRESTAAHVDEAYEDAGAGPIFEEFVRSVHAGTQKLLKDAGIESVTLFRGMKWMKNEPSPFDEISEQQGLGAKERRALAGVDSELLAVVELLRHEEGDEHVAQMIQARLARVSETMKGKDQIQRILRLWRLVDDGEYGKAMSVATGLQQDVERELARGTSRKFVGSTRVKLNPASSFAWEAVNAELFASGDKRAMMAMRVPRERILSLPYTGMGCLHEAEAVVVGGEVEAVVGYGPASPTSARKLMEMAAKKTAVGKAGGEVPFIDGDANADWVKQTDDTQTMSALAKQGFTHEHDQWSRHPVLTKHDEGGGGVAIGVLLDKDGNVVAGKRTDEKHPDLYVLPGGHIGAGETPAQGAAREFEEEAGVPVRSVRELDQQNGSGGHRLHFFLLEARTSRLPRDTDELRDVRYYDPDEVDLYPGNREVVELGRQSMVGKRGFTHEHDGLERHPALEKHPGHDDQDVHDPRKRKGAAGVRVRVPRGMREVVLGKEPVCSFCGTTKGPMDVDHKVPVKLGGKNVKINLQAACQSCNRARGAKDPSRKLEWVKHSMEQVREIMEDAIRQGKFRRPVAAAVLTHAHDGLVRHSVTKAHGISESGSEPGDFTHVVGDESVEKHPGHDDQSVHGGDNGPADRTVRPVKEEKDPFVEYYRARDRLKRLGEKMAYATNQYGMDHPLAVQAKKRYESGRQKVVHWKRLKEQEE